MEPPSVHFLEFTPAVDPADHPDRFHVLWHLDARKPPVPNNKSTPSSADAHQWRGLAEGDLVVFPSLLSGAGEFEAVRFVGPTTTHMMEDGSEEEVLTLLAAGIEYPEFPTLVVSLAEGRGTSLREMYERPFDAILQSHPPRLSLFDLYSRDEVAYNEFWAAPPVARRRRPPSGSPWRFSLGECVWIETVKGRALAAETMEEL
ncbi:hypothetical protein ACHAXT_002221 [Thalassiosira profunda]